MTEQTARARAADEPVPYSLTAAAEAALAGPPATGRYPGINDPEELARWCGFASAADMCAAYEEYARDLEARAAAEAEEEAALEAEYAAEWADNWDSEDAAAYMDRVEARLEPEAEL
jgi:hypothetical protein